MQKIVINKYENLVFLEKKEEIIDKRLANVLNDYNGKLSFGTAVKIKFEASGNVLKAVKKMIEYFEKAGQTIN